MPPKVDTDVKLSQLRSYVAANVAVLASSEKTMLKDIFGVRQRESKEEASFYKFLWACEKSFTDAQRTHAEETLAILTQYSASRGDAHPADGASRGDAHPADSASSGDAHLAVVSGEGAERRRSGSL